MAENEQTALITTEESGIAKRSILEAMSKEYDMEPKAFLDAIRQVVFPPLDRKDRPPTNAQMIAYLAVCHQYKLNPFLRQLWPFPMKDGGFIPAMAFDGWLDCMNKNPNFNGDEYEEIRDENGKLIAGQVKIWRKDRPDRPTIKKCFFDEWKRDTPTWKSIPSHMMELRTYCQGIRKAFGISGVYEEDELHRFEEKNITGVSVEMERTTLDRTQEIKKAIAEKQDNGKTQETPSVESAKTPEGKATPAPEAPKEAPKADETKPKKAETPPAQTETKTAKSETIIPPAETVEPEPKATPQDKADFVALAKAKAAEIGLAEDEAKSRMRQVLADNGAKTFGELPKSKLPKLAEAVKAWTK